MTRFRRLICACACAAFAAALAASAASAATFYVNNRIGEETVGCGVFQSLGHAPQGPCATIKQGIKRAEGTPGNVVVVTSANGPFEEQIHLANSADKGLTIRGEEGEAEVVTTGAFGVEVATAAGSVTLSNLSIRTTGASDAVLDSGAALTLSNDQVRLESGKYGVQAVGGAVSIEGGGVSMEQDSGQAVYGKGTQLSVNGAQIINGEGGAPTESGGIYSQGGTLSVTNTKVLAESGGGSTVATQGIVDEGDTTAVLVNTTVRQESQYIGVILEGGSATVEGLRVEMEDPASTTEAVLVEGAAGNATFSHVETLGAWAGAGMEIFGGNPTVIDSHLSTNGVSEANALRYIPGVATRGLLIQRSVLRGATKANPGTLDVVGANATVDSSEILSGVSNVFFESPEGAHTLTIAGSSLGGVPGIIFEKPGVVGVDANASGTHASQANVAIEGSLILNSQVATAASGDKATVTCTYSAVPSQIQTPNLLTHTGEIACAAGTTGNTNSSAEGASLFAEPFANYSLKPTSRAIDSVPVGAIALPFGITPSATDLAGAPRVVDGNGDCIAVQDKGALELQGHSAPCPLLGSPISTPKGSVPGPVIGVLTGLTISPRAFLAAPKGATLSRAAKKKYGAKISYRDSQAATTTFTVLRPSSGRRQGKSCKKPSTHNRHGKRCTILTKVASFTHADVAGAESLHFSGRFGGRKLSGGTYTLRATTHDAAGSGAPVSKSFTIQ